MQNDFCKTLLVASVSTLLTTPVLSYDKGDLIVRAGAAMVAPQEDSGAVVLNGSAIANSEVSVDDDTQLGLTFTYMISNEFGFEVLAATPFSHDVEADLGGTVLAAGSSKHLPPTLSMVYYPWGSSNSFKPYLGWGLNYTVFFSEEVDSELEALIGSPGDMEMDDSFGLALQIGFDYAFNDQWHINASVRKIDIDTEAEIEFDNGAVVTTSVDIDPLVYQINAGYRF